MPDYTTPPIATPGFGLAAADWNAKIRDSMEDLAKPKRCKVKRVAALSPASGATVSIPFDTEVYDSDNIWTAGSPTLLTVPKTGLYLVLFTVQFQINATGIRQITIKHGASIICTSNLPGTAAGFVGGSLAVEELANAGDTFSFTVFQNSGGALALDVTTADIAASIRQVAR